MLPVVTIVGRPNVGKSTLFNLLTGTRDALVADFPGVTRDRQYGLGMLGDRPYHIVDTGGIAEPDDPQMAQATDEQVDQAIDEADLLLFMVDAKDGLASADRDIAQRMRQFQDRVVVVVNKVDRDEAATALSDFYQLGFENIFAISATSHRGVEKMMQEVLQRFPVEEHVDDEVEAGIKIAVIGRPNVGKSTLINRMLGEDRVVVMDRPGTTRDSIFIPFERQDQHYTLIDTAGVRRRSKVTETIEKFSIIKTLRAIDQAHVVLVVVNAQENISDQDLRLLSMVVKAGKALVVVINKWDHMEDYDRSQVKEAVERRLQFVDFARRYFISALHGTGVGKLYHAIHEAYESLHREMTTPVLTKILNEAQATHQPPLVRGRRVKLRFAHLGGRNPLHVVIHGKQTAELPLSYKRYLVNFFRKAFKMVGVPLIMRFKSDKNPYVDKGD